MLVVFPSLLQLLLLNLPSVPSPTPKKSLIIVQFIFSLDWVPSSHPFIFSFYVRTRTRNEGTDTTERRSLQIPAYPHQNLRNKHSKYRIHIQRHTDRHRERKTRVKFLKKGNENGNPNFLSQIGFWVFSTLFCVVHHASPPKRPPNWHKSINIGLPNLV